MASVLYALSIDSGSDAQNARIRVEMEQALGYQSDPLELLIAEEEGKFDNELACRYLNATHTL